MLEKNAHLLDFTPFRVMCIPTKREIAPNLSWHPNCSVNFADASITQAQSSRRRKPLRNPSKFPSLHCGNGNVASGGPSNPNDFDAGLLTPPTPNSNPNSAFLHPHTPLYRPHDKMKNSKRDCRQTTKGVPSPGLAVQDTGWKTPGLPR